MKRTELETKYLKNKTGINLKRQKEQNNFCSKLYKQGRKKYYNKLNMNSITDNTEFLTTISPFLSDKDTAQTEISVENKSNGSEVL